MKEADIMRTHQMAASQRGDRLFRNNCGVLMDSRGVPVRFGLCVGSGDLIGWTRTVITPGMVGQTMAIFTSAEIKTSKGKVTEAQENWGRVVQQAGGIHQVIRGEAT